MKSERVRLADWEVLDDTGNLDIDWPKVHKLAGVDKIEWIMDKTRDQCQMVIERAGDKKYSIFVEFYSDSILVEYYLKWAK